MSASLSTKPAHPKSATAQKVDVRPPRTGYRGLTILTWVLGVVLTFFFVQATAGTAVPAATAVGRWYGIIGVLCFLFLAGYGFRRQAYRSKALGSLQFWYRAHLLVGVLALVLVGCHCASAFLGAAEAGKPGLIGMIQNAGRSAFLGWLQAGFWFVIGTGLFGWCYQTALRTWMIRNEHAPSIRKELEVRRQRLKDELKAMMVKSDDTQSGLLARMSDDVLARAIDQIAIRRRLSAISLHNWSYWDAQMEAALKSDGLPTLPAEAVQRLRELNRVEILLTYHEVLRWWTHVHLFATALAVMLMLWHVYQVALWPR